MDAQDIVVFITDAASNDATGFANQALVLSNNGFYINLIGVGNNINSVELNNVKSTARNTALVVASGYSSLYDVTNTMNPVITPCIGALIGS